MILLHIIGGLIGLTSGAAALSAPKGGTLHRKSGMIFVYAMSVLAISGGMMAALIPERISVLAGMLTLYLVTTALLTVRRRIEGFRWMDVVAMVVALGIGFLSFAFALTGLNSPTGDMDGVTPVGLIFGAVALLAAVGDARWLLVRGIRGHIVSRVICGTCVSHRGSPPSPSFLDRWMSCRRRCASCHYCVLRFCW